jgi:hypothetical protein
VKNVHFFKLLLTYLSGLEETINTRMVFTGSTEGNVQKIEVFLQTFPAITFSNVSDDAVRTVDIVSGSLLHFKRKGLKLMGCQNIKIKRIIPYPKLFVPPVNIYPFHSIISIKSRNHSSIFPVFHITFLSAKQAIEDTTLIQLSNN